ncbi:phosphotransferase family protein [Desemzia sp. C1]|uniref:Thiamine kinase n=1 Tax=Desemzia incerta TaxID=82801 RepID=A0A1I5VZU5_9LACT|nr:MULTISPECIES: phosphotransferase family protein [Desemzia]MCI3029360.1 phosphotransferase family protein [Desemzia sp. C1]SFQ13009.1 Thiamine kinase [Desemzia incerta]
MDLEYNSGWKLHPIGGDTGQAYMGTKAEEKLFLKRNSSPFLAALSVEGITPRLIWTKRIGNGDVLTAQEWLNGRTLEKEEMSSLAVAQLLSRIHNSENLRRMLTRVGGQEIRPTDLMQDYQRNLPLDLKNHSLLAEVFNHLMHTIPFTDSSLLRVCHGDVYRKNWLLSDENRLYLVDWDSAMLCDPAMDLGVLLCQYIDRSSWEEWLSHYGITLTEELTEKMTWYAAMNYLSQIKQHHKKARFHKMNQDIIRLQELMQHKK